MAQASELTLETTPIPGLVVLRLPVHEDSRGWFKENWQREKMTALGLPDFGPVQNNISFNTHRGATRGIHTEPWDKFVSVATGRVFAAWVDMREGEHFGTTFHVEIDPGVAVFVPRGVGNSYQSLEDGTAYSYLVNEHWRAGTTYPALHLGDPTVAIPWPIPLEAADISAKDHANPVLADVTPMPPKRILITGAGGQLGRALAQQFPTAHAVGRAELDLADSDALAAWPWHEYAAVLNAAAYTVRRHRGDRGGPPCGVDRQRRCTRSLGRRRPRASSDARPLLVRLRLRRHRERARRGRAPVAAGRLRPEQGGGGPRRLARPAALHAAHLVGDRRRQQLRAHDAALAEKGVSPSVVDDQVGRLTFTGELARATRHLIDAAAAVRHLQRHQRRRAHVLGGPGEGGLPTVREVDGRHHGRHDVDLLGGQGARSAALGQRAEPGQAPGHRLRPGGRARRTRALLRDGHVERLREVDRTASDHPARPTPQD